MKPLIEVLNLAVKQLEEHQVVQPRRQAEELISEVLKLSRIDLYMQHDRPLSEEEQQLCRARIARRAKHEPLAYILGFVPFHDCQFKVTPSVLIPRQDTEHMVSFIMDQLSKEDLEGKILWDLCTGSGCIGIALKKKFPALQVVLSDISPQALEIARYNAEFNEVDVILREGDLLAPFAGAKAHFVTCNPPYISEKEFDSLEPEVRDHEPYNALVGAENGLVFYKRLDRELPNHLHYSGKAWIEIGSSQGDAIKNIFKNPLWKNVSLKQDLSNQDRFFSLEIE